MGQLSHLNNRVLGLRKDDQMNRVLAFKIVTFAIGALVLLSKQAFISVEVATIVVFVSGVLNIALAVFFNSQVPAVQGVAQKLRGE